MVTEPTAPPTLAERRPRRADAARNFDALLAAGREAFNVDGPNASLEDIARRAGVGIGTLYRNFPTKDALIETIYLGEIDALVAAARDVEGLEPWPALRAWLDRFVDYVGTKHALLAGLNGESTVFAECRASMMGAGAPLIARAQAAGEVKPELGVSDVVKLVSAVTAVAVEDEEQRRRLVDLAIGSLRV
ncbi:TetR/AcrR family transcriptional regulator [uncultured Microbacterium sp.]|uniref:TetR/AcrR family transcriptional regulator n=1 Tax=uncultured Microbacterium sp. TaxID=191216 RepID=UPI0025FD4CF1|nr:TetR/AcrR family transcriptional regulator [uncultured Microbacterium sp.]